ncbi:MAG TPA: glucose-6-phosphate dehydrogenase [Gaiellaceae bacterium]
MAVATQSTTDPRSVALDPYVLVLFGAGGDLARRKLLPGLFHLNEVGLLPDDWRVIGASTQEMSNDEFRAFARQAVEEFGRMALDRWDAFVERVTYVGGGFQAGNSDRLKAAVEAAQEELPKGSKRLFFFAVPPVASPGIVQGLGEAGLNEDARVIMEKPFGTDLSSAKALNAVVHSVLDESQVYRIDHFLGKEAVQNILALRFANGLFEPIWNRDHIDHVEIDVPETLTVAQRAGFYDATGAFRDMVVTHLFQVLGFVAMEPPAALTPEALVAEKIKVFDSMRIMAPDDVVRGQYDGYLEHDGVAPKSDTETFIAGKVHIDNWRWAGVPFYFRTGKRLPEGKRIATISLREPPLQIFHRSGIDTEDLRQNHLSFDLGDEGGISAGFLAKNPGPTVELGPAHMEFVHDQAGDPLEAYERLIHDAMMGDKTLFTTANGIERLWEIATPVLDNPPPVRPYEQGSWGPKEIADLIAPHSWYLPHG